MNELNNNFLEHLKSIARNYRVSTGVQCRLLDVQNKKFVETASLHKELIYLFNCHEGSCLEKHIISAQLSEKYGGNYIYFCNETLLFWVSPIFYNSKLVMALVAGPAIIIEVDEWLNEKEKRSRAPLDSFVETIPHLSPDKVNHLSELLRMCGAWGSGLNVEKFEAVRNDVEQINKISEKIHELKEERSLEVCQNKFIAEQEYFLQDAIKWGDKQKAQSIMNNLLGQIFFSENETLDRIKYRVIDLIFILSRAAMQGGALHEEISEISYTCQRELDSFKSLEGLANWLSKVCHKYSDLVFEKKESEYGFVIAKSLQYIRRNFQNKISLEEVATHVSLSPNYFSQLFNTKIETSFSSYINRLRVEYATQLLTTTNLSIIEIAGLTGFDDQSYFTKIFKSFTGLTPLQFRKKSRYFPEKRPS